MSADGPPLKYTGLRRDEVRMPLTTTRFAGDERWLIEPRNKLVRFPNKPQFLRLFRTAKEDRFMDEKDNRYLKVSGDSEEDGGWYCLLKSGSSEYPRDGQVVSTTDGRRRRIKGTYFVPPRATGIVYFDDEQ